MNYLHKHVLVAIVLHLLVLIVTFGLIGAQTGVCYKTLGNNLPSAKEVVSLYQQKGIKRMRIIETNTATLQALRGTNIELIIGVANIDLPVIAANQTIANTWVQNNIKNYGNVKIKYIAVGNEVTTYEKAPPAYSPYLLPAMNNIQKALLSLGLGKKVKVSTPSNFGIMGVSFPPSKGHFKENMKPIIRFLVTNNSPLLLNVHPYYSYVKSPKDIKLDYALFNSKIPVVHDGWHTYRNLFDAMIDSAYVALAKVGGASLNIVVSETGWPSAGGFAANINNSRIYNQNLIRHVKQGTPRRPGKPLETYISAMFDENEKIKPVEKYWGLFLPNKKPKYPLSFA